MFNFTGTVGRQRNVNLSGRSPANKKTPSTSTLPPSLRASRPSTTSVAAAAREERAARAVERKRKEAAEKIQRVWRGRWASGKVREEWKREWEVKSTSPIEPKLALFWGYVGLGKRKIGKVERRMVMEMVEIIGEEVLRGAQGREAYLMHRFLEVLTSSWVGLVEGAERGEVEKVMELLPRLVKVVKKVDWDSYFTALAATVKVAPEREVVVPAVEAGLGIKEACAAFAERFLTTPGVLEMLGSNATGRLKAKVDLGLIQIALEERSGLGKEDNLWLLAHVLYLTHQSPTVVDLTEDDHQMRNFDSGYLTLVSLLFTPVAIEIRERIAVEDTEMDDDDEDTSRLRKNPLPPFIKSQIQWLIKQESVLSLLRTTGSHSDSVKALSRYAINLLVAFPTNRAEIRMWLNLAKTRDGVPALRYVWDYVKHCTLFADIKREETNAKFAMMRTTNRMNPKRTPGEVEDDLNVVFLFLEIYGFLLSVTDDNEFFVDEGAVGRKMVGRQLRLEEVKDLTVFLKNLGFAMYFYSGEIMEEKEVPQLQQPARGWELKQFRDVVTSVMRAIYARDSRRQFLPQDHWLMTKLLNMDGFISAVVEEDEERRKLELEQLGHDSDDDYDDAPDDDEIDPEILAMADEHMQRHFRLHRQEKKYRKARQAHRRAAIAPRLEILQNLPFFIPFSTRVQIFREFVENDGNRRHIEQINRRQRSIHHPDDMAGHHAIVRRGEEFEDALKAFWQLGSGLKDAIKITFVDQFGEEEAGIDGGGVTKEFLTSVCGKAFTPRTHEELEADQEKILLPYDEDAYEYDTSLEYYSHLFRENSEHLLYPDPISVELLKHLSTTSNLTPAETKTHIENLLKRYEFAGRIVGKCLYEGILLDIAFAPFFLLKWAQPSPTASTVGVNDLRDLDKDFYRSLMQLKDYDGDVESVFSLDFTVDTQITPGNVITRPLKLNGHLIPVNNSNRLEYIHLIARYRLMLEPSLQTSAFLKGLSLIISPNWLRMFNQSELQTLVGGLNNSEIDVDDLRKNTYYSGVYQIGDDGEEHQTVKWFWEVMRELDGKERGKVLRFVTSVARPPLLGFGVLRPLFTIRDAGEDQSRLCTASTCVNLLKMPRYKTKEILKERLLYSVNAGAGFDLS